MPKERPNRVIFLDVDGVLCTDKAALAYGADPNAIDMHWDQTSVKLLARLCEKTQAKIVISSTWREEFEYKHLKAVMLNAGFAEVPFHTNWKTPTNGPTRGDEIEQWMISSGRPDYVILDDNDDFLDVQKPRFVYTEEHDGFGWHHYMKVLKLFGVNP